MKLQCIMRHWDTYINPGHVKVINVNKSIMTMELNCGNEESSYTLKYESLEKLEEDRAEITLSWKD